MAFWVFMALVFLSTPSVRRATDQSLTPTMGVKQFLSTPSVRRATRRADLCGSHHCISIHALREEGDEVTLIFLPSLSHFYPRPP